MCIPYVVWKEHKLYIISLIYLTAVIKLLGRKFLMFGQTLISKLGKTKIFLKRIISHLITCSESFMICNGFIKYLPWRIQFLQKNPIYSVKTLTFVLVSCWFFLVQTFTTEHERYIGGCCCVCDITLCVMNEWVII